MCKTCYVLPEDFGVGDGGANHDEDDGAADVMVMVVKMILEMMLTLMM